MAPMMKPLPRPIGKGEQKFRAELAAEAAAKRRPHVSRRLVIISTLCGAAAGPLIWAILQFAGVPEVERPVPKLQSASAMLEQGDAWYHDAKGPRLGLPEDVLRNPRMKPGHRKFSSKTLMINLRTLTPVPVPLKEGEKPPPVESESRAPGAPAAPAAPTLPAGETENRVVE